MTFDLDKITESKERYRRKLAALPFGEKLRILDRMRERDCTLQRAARQIVPAHRATQEPVDDCLNSDYAD